MAVSFGQTGTADSVDAEYFNWESSDKRFLVHMHLDAVDGLARDVIENANGLPVEVGGILLGQVGRGDRPVIWIERYQRVEIEHRSGPQFVLDRNDHTTFEQAAQTLSETEELSVVGYYRSHLRPGFQLEQADHELVDRYFNDAEDLILLLKPENKLEILAQFFGRMPSGAVGLGELQAMGPAYPFRGRVLGVLASERDDDPAERTAKRAESPDPANSGKTALPPPIPLPQRKLVADFQPAGQNPRPAREFFVSAESFREPRPVSATVEGTESRGIAGFFHKRWPLLAALLLVSGAVGVLIQQEYRRETPSAPAADLTSSVRPIGLYVDPSSQTWRVSWNTSAPALQGARSAKLFIRDGDDQSPVDLSPTDLRSGTYQYAAKGRDVTFRLEAKDAAGRLSAESFRVVTPPPAPSPPKPSVPPVVPRLAGNLTPPHATHRVAPVVPSSIRPRINGTIPLDVRVRVDARGRVISAVPARKPRAGVESFLAARAVYAARQWRFEPARQDGKPVPGAEVIHFVFNQ